MQTDGHLGKGCRGRDNRRYKGSFWSDRNVSHLHFGDGGYMAHWTVITVHTHTPGYFALKVPYECSITIWPGKNLGAPWTPLPLDPYSASLMPAWGGQGLQPFGDQHPWLSSSSPGDSERSVPSALAQYENTHVHLYPKIRQSISCELGQTFWKSNFDSTSMSGRSNQCIHLLTHLMSLLGMYPGKWLPSFPQREESISQKINHYILI